MVSVWPVGLVGKLRYEAPILTNGKVSLYGYLHGARLAVNIEAT